MHTGRPARIAYTHQEPSQAARGVPIRQHTVGKYLSGGDSNKVWVPEPCTTCIYIV